MTPFPLVLLHHAGGSVEIFDALVRALPPTIEPVPLDLPGHGRRWRDTPMTAADDAVDWLVEALASVDGEFGILGHSLGAYLGLALAARLEETEGESRCSTLFASAIAGPLSAELPTLGPLPTTDRDLFEIAAKSGIGLPDYVLGHDQQHARTADLLRADLSLSETFLRKQRRTVTEADIIVCCGTEDIFSVEQLEQWRLNSTESTQIFRIPGGRSYLESDVSELTQIIEQQLAFRGRRRSPSCSV
ncbi:thioesterase II family protein [Streptomyces sp. NRAIS4]